ncbi:MULTISPECIES: 3D domain-containing protein [Bacillus amyloliquefaciens group]|uniref:3D domain-containing protein n=1 Tax=Bacillus amyloliquefaciens group TaxID=1938374 RepID=UPI00223F595C|nr:3D domain-containing protein [Bacillus velezensis]MCY0089281.1 3D domain-containing protein [Bacillus velezensis]
MKIFKKLIDKNKKYVYYNINSIKLTATVMLLFAGVVVSVKNINSEKSEVDAKEEPLHNKKQKELLIESLTHQRENNCKPLPKIKSSLDKRIESQEKYINAKIIQNKLKKVQHKRLPKKDKNKYQEGKDKAEIKATEKTRKPSHSLHSISVVATAYTAFCSSGCVGKTRTGYDVSSTSYFKGKRIIAVDPKIIPLNSLVEVSYKGNSFQAYAIDTGGDIKNNRIDILMNTEDEARLFGRRAVKVNVLKN